MKNKVKNIVYLLLSVTVLGILITYIKPILIANNNINNDDNLASARRNSNKKNTAPNPTLTNFQDTFDTNYSLEEAGNFGEGSNNKWWLNSGGYLYSSNGIGSTILGELSSLDKWRVAFYAANAIDTDNGYHPQNIFRLIQKNYWKNFTQELYFKIDKNNLSESPNRNASNGVLLFNRYKDEYNLYYTGIRVDGYAVIKKKINGVYYTMAYNPVFKNGLYNKDSNPNLLPINTWMGIRSVITTNSDNIVNIKVYLDKDKTNKWELVAEANDNGKDFGGGAILNEGFAGIRTDFMDVFFDDYKISSL